MMPNMSLNMSQDLLHELFEVEFDPLQALKMMAVVCAAYFTKHPVPTQPGVVYCNSTFDSFSCWPTTRAGGVAKVACPDISVADPNVNATKECFDNGTWAVADYATCMVENVRKVNHLDNLYPSQTLSVRIIYDVGFTVTTVVLIVALAIFIHLKSLRCLRNSLHCNLFLAFIFSNIMWLVMHHALNEVYSGAPEWVCKLLMAATTYFHACPFYWMFVEGLYLFTIIVWAFSTQKLRLWYYLVIGWVVPFVVTATWAAIKDNFEKELCWLHTDLHVDYIVHVPIIVLLLSNVIFMVTIIWVLVTKMKASNSLETRQTRKAVKATVVLVPLLGLTYVMFLRSPFDDEIVNILFQHINAVLQSSQGLFVAIFYCFLNGEVRSVLRQKLNSLQDSRSLSRYTKTTTYGSPRRSSCFIPNGNGKNGFKGGTQMKITHVADLETEASVLMMDQIENKVDVSQHETT